MSVSSCDMLAEWLKDSGIMWNNEDTIEDVRILLLINYLRDCSVRVTASHDLIIAQQS